MSRNPFKRFIKKHILNQIAIPKDLASVTHIDKNSEQPFQTEVESKAIDSIWGAVEALYQTGMFPGVSFCIWQGGKVRLNRTLGHLSGNGPHDTFEQISQIKLTPQTPVCLFSASKAVTAMLVHSLVEQGEIQLDDPITRYLSGFKTHRSPTILQILAHQAGIPKLPLHKGSELIFDYAQMVEAIYDLQPQWEAGDKVGYHAVTGGYIMGELIRKVTGDDIQVFLKQLIGEPMGMKYFSYGVEPEASRLIAKNYFTGFAVTPPFSTILTSALGVPVEEIVDISNDFRFQTAVIPAVNIMSTALEASSFYQLLLAKGVWGDKQIFQPETILQATQPQSKLAIDYVLKIPMRYSAGMMLGESPLGLFGPSTKNAFGHLGFTNNLCWADPDRDIAVALLTTGNPVVGTHLPKFFKLLTEISNLPKI